MSEYSEWSNDKLLDEYVGNLLRPYRGTEEIRAAILERMQPEAGWKFLGDRDILQKGDIFVYRNDKPWILTNLGIGARVEDIPSFGTDNYICTIRPIHQEAQPEPELLSCPFCGRKAELIQRSNELRC